MDIKYLLKLKKVQNNSFQLSMCGVNIIVQTEQTKAYTELIFNLTL